MINNGNLCCVSPLPKCVTRSHFGATSRPASLIFHENLTFLFSPVPRQMAKHVRRIKIYTGAHVWMRGWTQRLSSPVPPPSGVLCLRVEGVPAVPSSKDLEGISALQEGKRALGENPCGSAVDLQSKSREQATLQHNPSQSCHCHCGTAVELTPLPPLLFLSCTHKKPWEIRATAFWWNPDVCRFSQCCHASVHAHASMGHLSGAPSLFF